MRGLRVALMKSAVVAGAVLPAVGCSTVATNFDFDPAFDYGSLQTWAWASPEVPGVALDQAGNRNTLAEGRLKTAVENGFEQKGYRMAQAGEDVDFRVAFFASAEEQVDVSTTYSGYGYRWGYAPAQTTVRAYTQGTLVLDVVKPDEDELLWRGQASGAIEPGNPDRAAERANDAVAALLDDFPPTGGS